MFKTISDVWHHIYSQTTTCLEKINHLPKNDWEYFPSMGQLVDQWAVLQRLPEQILQNMIILRFWLQKILLHWHCQLKYKNVIRTFVTKIKASELILGAYFHICVQLNHANQHFIFHFMSLLVTSDFLTVIQRCTPLLLWQNKAIYSGGIEGEAKLLYFKY